MGEIARLLSEQGQLETRYRAMLTNLARSLLKGECLFFLGAGASLDRSQLSLPSGSELSHLMADACELKWHEDVPLSTTAFYYEFMFKRSGLNALLDEKISPEKILPSTTIRRLVDIVGVLEEKQRAVLIATTNYDQHFERAYQEAFKKAPGVVIYQGATNSNDNGAKLHLGIARNPEYWWPERGTHLFKLHGCISQVREQAPEFPSVVITEEDYINFLANATSTHPNKCLPVHVRARLAEQTILFVGYSLSDWNFRVIFKATAEATRAQPSYAVQYRAPNTNPTRWQAMIEFWALKKVDIVNADAAEFMTDLLAQVREETAR